MKTSKFKALERMTVAHSHNVCMLLLAALIVSCEAPDFGVTMTRNEISALAVTDRYETTVDGMPDTKGPIMDGVFPNQAFAMSASFTPTGGSRSTFFENISFSKSGDYWVPSNTKYWPKDGQTMFLAYSAPSLSFTPVWTPGDAGAGFEVSSMPDNRTRQTDILYAGTGNISQSSGAVTLNFQHAQALLKFTGISNESYNSAYNRGVTVTSITVSSLRYRGRFSVSQSTNGTVTPSWSASTTGSATLYSGTGRMYTYATDLGTGFMVYPQNPVAITINYTLHNGKDASGHVVDLTRSFSFTPTGTWAAGLAYTYALSFTEGEISVSASLSPWDAASQTWFYATGNTVSQLGGNFPFSTASNMWWRLSSSDSYESLSYVDGSWGSSVRLESSSYYVTVARNGGNYSVSYTPKRRLTGISFNYTGVYDSQNRVNYTTTNEGSYDKVILTQCYGNFSVSIFDYLSSIVATYDDGSSQAIIPQSLTASTPSNTGAEPYVKNGNIRHGLAAYNYIANTGLDYYEITATATYTEGGVTINYSRTLRLYATFYIYHNGDPYYTASGQTMYIPTRAQNSICKGGYYTSDMSGWITSCSTTRIDLLQYSSGNAMVVKAGASNTDSAPVTYTITSSDGRTFSGSCTVWGSEATKGIELRVLTGSPWGVEDYVSSNYYDYPYVSNHYAFDAGYGVNLDRTFDDMICNGGDEEEAMYFLVFKFKGDGSISNISGESGLSWSYNPWHGRVYGYDENSSDASVQDFDIYPFSWGWGYGWPPETNYAFNNSQPVLSTGIYVHAGWLGYENEYYTNAWRTYYGEYYYYEPIFENFHHSNFVTVTYNGFSSSIGLQYWWDD